MSNKKISQFQVVTTLNGTTYVPVIQGSPLFDAIISASNFAASMQDYNDNYYIKVDGTNSDIDYLNFNPDAIGNPQPYVRKWDAAEGTFVFGLPDGGIIQEGKELFDYYVNADTVPLVNGDIVSIVPIAGNRKAIARTDVTNATSAKNCIGMVTVASIAVGQEGRITKFGEVHDLLTSLYPDGTELFVSESNPGKWATVGATPPNYTVRIGTVIVSQNGNGIVELGIQCFPKLGDLSDVNGVSSSVNKPIVRKADGVIDAIDNLTLASFSKTGSSDAEVLLGGGGSKTLQSIYDTSAGVVAQYAADAEQAAIDAEAAKLVAQNAQDAAEAAQLAAEQAEATALANNELLGGIAYNASAPTPGKSGKYSFTTGGSCTWLTGGAATVAVGDEVVVVFTAPSTYTYTKVGRPDIEQTRSQSTSKVPSSKLVDDELNKLNQWVGFIAQSPDWTIDSSYNVSIPAGNIDVYYSNKFYRITTAQSFAVHSGTDSICFDTLDNTIKRVSTPVIGQHVILGVYNGYKVQLNGYVKVNYPNGIIYNKILQSEINALIDTKINANYEKVLFFVNRGSVTANGATVTIGTGTYYFIIRTGTEYSKTLSSPESFTLTSDQVLVFNTTSRLFSQKNKSTVLTDDCILLLYDSTDGYSQNGLWANSLIDNRITRLEDDYISLKIVAHIIRGGIEISGANVTVKAGYYYFESQYGVEYSKLVASDTIYTLSSDGVLVFDLNSKNFISQGKTSTTKNQIVLLFYDGAKGVVPSGIWATDVLNDKIINLTNRVSSLENQNLNVPSFINTEANATFKRLLSWLGSDDAHLIAQITDVHSFGNNKYIHLKYLSELNKLFGFDLLWNGGDIGLDSGETETQAYDLLQNTKNGMQSVIPFIYTRGNHDYGTQAMSVGKINAVFNLPQKRQFRDKLNLVHGDSTGGYGYFDNSDLKIRTYFANTSEKNSAGFGMSATQLQWFADSLANIQANWNVIIINHLCVDPIGRWISYPDDASGAQFDTYRSIMSAFVNKTSGNNATTSVSWNFTSVPVTAKLVCNIAGDSHFNNQTVTSGVNYIVRQGYGSVSDSEMPSGSTKDALDYTSQCLFDILAVKSNGTAKVFRIGAGGEIRDYEFTY